MKLLSIFIACCLFIGCSKMSSSENEQPSNFSLDYVELGISFPAVANSEQRNFSEPLLKELNVTHIRIGENWSFREPTEGTFNWQPLDDRINWAQENNFEVLLTIQSNGPDWACSSDQNSNSCVYADMLKFKNYIETLLQRYPNKISKIQYGNEWQSNFWYVGNAQQFTNASNIVYDAIQIYSPDTKFVLGGFTTISLRFLSGCSGQIDGFYDDEGTFYDQAYFQNNCGGDEIMSVVNRIDYVLNNANYDEIDIHLYDDVENWDIYYNTIKKRVTKPVIVSEFGGPNLNLEPNTESYQAQRLELYIKKIDSMQINEAYFFKLIEGTSNPAHLNSALISASDLEKKESFNVFKNLNN